MNSGYVWLIRSFVIHLVEKPSVMLVIVIARTLKSHDHSYCMYRRVVQGGYGEKLLWLSTYARNEQAEYWVARGVNMLKVIDHWSLENGAKRSFEYSMRVRFRCLQGLVMRIQCAEGDLRSSWCLWTLSVLFQGHLGGPTCISPKAWFWGARQQAT